MHQQQRGRPRRLMTRAAAVTGRGALVSALCAVGVSSPAMGSAHTPVARAAAGQHQQAGSCRLGNGNKHVVDLTYDNVHFFRDNPNVLTLSDAMPGNGAIIVGCDMLALVVIGSYRG